MNRATEPTNLKNQFKDAQTSDRESSVACATEFFSSEFGTRVFVGLGVACALLAMSDLMYKKHPHVQYEAWFNFYGFVALVSTVAICLVCVGLKSLLHRSEDYYDG